jgi:hypothetical protein
MYLPPNLKNEPRENCRTDLLWRSAQLLDGDVSGGDQLVIGLVHRNTILSPPYIYR